MTKCCPRNSDTDPVSTTSDESVSSVCSTYRVVRSTAKTMSPYRSILGRWNSLIASSMVSSCSSKMLAMSASSSSSGSCRPSQTNACGRPRAAASASS